MVTLRVNVDITEDREVRIKLPDDFPVGKATVIITSQVGSGVETEDDKSLSSEEIKGFLNFKGLTLGEIETGGWAGRGITDSVQFVEELRRKAWRKTDL